jgi:cell wall-associated NlpC family hydrolase
VSLAERQRVVSIAKTWLRTPYVHMGRVKGAGCDCATLIAEVYEEAGLVPRVDLDYYSPQWHLHRDAERYLDRVLSYASVVEEPLPGDVVLFRFGRTFSHGAIVVDWPKIIHAYVGASVSYEDASTAQWLVKIGADPRPRKFLSHWVEDHGLFDNSAGC